MKRLGKLAGIIRAVLTVASLFLFIASLTVWVRSYVSEDTLIWRRRGGDSWIAGASMGQVRLGHSLYPGIDPRARGRNAGLYHSKTPPSPYIAGIILDSCRTDLPYGSFLHPLPPPGYTYFDYADFAPIHRTYFERAGFAYQEGLHHVPDNRGLIRSTTVSSRIVLLPCWFIALAAGLLPTAAAGRFVLRRRHSRRAVGFDLSKPSAEPAGPESNASTGST